MHANIGSQLGEICWIEVTIYSLIMGELSVQIPQHMASVRFKFHEYNSLYGKEFYKVLIYVKFILFLFSFAGPLR